MQQHTSERKEEGEEEEAKEEDQEQEQEQNQDQQRELQDLLLSVFGDSDSDLNNDEGDAGNKVHPTGWNQAGSQWVWERSDKVAGLWLCRNLLSEFQQQKLLAAINAEGWFHDSVHNQAMRFGQLPRWALELSSLIRDTIASYCNSYESGGMSIPSQNLQEDLPLAHDILWREPLFDQMIVNCYQPGEGICAHVDLLRFEDGIAIVSLESACVMHFTYVKQPCRVYEIEREKIERFAGGSQEMDFQQTRSDSSGVNADLKDEIAVSKRVPVLLMPGDLVLLSGEARYDWMHEINRKELYQIWNGQQINQEQRISVTLRRLCQLKS